MDYDRWLDRHEDNPANQDDHLCVHCDSDTIDELWGEECKNMYGADWEPHYLYDEEREVWEAQMVKDGEFCDQCDRCYDYSDTHEE